MILSDSVSTIIAQLLKDENLFGGVGEDWPVFVDRMPSTKTTRDCASVEQIPGLMDGRYMKTGETITHPGFQVVVRGRDRNEVYNRINAVAQFFDGLHNQIVTVSGSTYNIVTVTARSEVIPLGLDSDTANRLYNFIASYVTTINLV